MKLNINNADLDLRNLKQKNPGGNDKFIDVMESFVRDAKSRYETLECMFNKMSDAYKELADFYTFESNKYTIGEFFTDVKTFSMQFQQCHDENAKLKETEEKIRRAEEEREKREKEKEARKTQKEKLMQTRGKGNGESGVMDNLLEALQSGELFEAKTNGPRGVRRPMRDARLQGNILLII